MNPDIVAITLINLIGIAFFGSIVVAMWVLYFYVSRMDRDDGNTMLLLAIIATIVGGAFVLAFAGDLIK